jgi:fucose 4-O-acetylase-like acetyltransferase
MKLKSFDYFRGVAILLIVTGHCYGPWKIDTFGEKFIANLITGGTALFVFISGFFFHYIYYPRFNYSKFILKKAKNVFLPYMIFTFLGLMYFDCYLNSMPLSESLLTNNLASLPSHIMAWTKYILTGAIITGYWYIPFIAIIFATSHVFVKQLTLPAYVQFLIFTILLYISTYIHRPINMLNPIHSALYFTPIYILGIMCSANKAYILKYLRGKSTILALLVILMSAIQALCYDVHGNFHKDNMLRYNGADIIIIQKIFICLFFLSVLTKLESVEIPFLRYLASTSFAIYFIHPWILYLLKYWSILDFIGFLPEIIVFAVTVPMVIGISLFVAAIFKVIFQEKSRFLIGW